MKLLVIAILVTAGFTANAQSLTSGEGGSFKEFIKQVDAKIPAKIKKTVGNYTVVFKDFGSLPATLCTKDVDLNQLVKTSIFKFRKRIYVSQALAPYFNSSARFPCANQTVQQITEKVILFQVASQYDIANSHWDNPTDKSNISTCENTYQEVRGKTEGNVSTICQYYLKNSYKISGSPTYKNLSDYKGNRIKSKNQMPLRLVNGNETSSPQEHFAINLTSFLVDPTYQCRKPAFQRYFAKLTGAVPFAPSECEKTTHLYTSSAGWKIDIAPEKVYQVHYLFAAKGEELMSRWGHSMLRLVVCAPQRTTVGPECLTDVAYHVVLSYRANVDDVVVNYWDGLTGKYPSQVMFFSMPEIVDEYTRGQWRELMSLPLKISKEQQDLLVESIQEHYWSYSGDYKFLTNNCASETDQLLRAALPKTHPYQDTFAASPLGIYKNLSRQKLIDLSLLNDKKAAQQKTYYFPTNKDALEKAFLKMRSHFPTYSNLTEWSQNSVAAERKEVYELLQTFEEIGSAYLLEKYVSLVQQRVQQTRLTKLLQNKTPDRRFTDVVEKIVESAQNRLPWNLSQGGYGIPLQNEVVSDEESNTRLQEAIKWNRQYRDLVLKAFPDVDSELIGIKQNLELLTNRRRF